MKAGAEKHIKGRTHLGLPRVALAVALVVAGWGAAVIAAQISAEEISAKAIGESAHAKPRLGEWGIETHYIAQDVAPGDDFFRYVNQGWLNTAEIPQGFPRLDSFLEVSLRSEEQIQAIIAEPHQDDIGGQQIQALYQSYMDEERLEKLGLTPIRAELRGILQLSSRSDAARWMAKPMQHSVVRIGVQLDAKAPDRHTLVIRQSGLGLPDRTYYLDDSPFYTSARRDYTRYIQQTLERAGIDWAEQRAADIVDFETRLAEAHWSAEALRDRIQNYQPMSIEELIAFAPGFDWAAFLQERQVAHAPRLIVESNTALKATAAMVGQTPVDTLRSYLLFHYIDNHAPLLSREFAEANFAFYSTRLNGIEEMRPRPLRAQRYVDSALGEVLGRIYVQRYFPEEHKAEVEKYIGYIRQAFQQRLQQSPWMDTQTRQQALAKLEQFSAKIGYPDHWRDFSAIDIRPTDLVGNQHRILAWHWNDALTKLQQPRRAWEWGMTPQNVNAYYSSTRNEIVFPAAILQPPFFDPAADAAVNFAAIGAVIGHEIGHGFDDQGSLSDGNGRLRDWWTPASRQQFEQRTAALVKQYSGYQPLAGLHINGQLTLGENIGDLGGLSTAYAAYRHYVAQEHDGKAPVLNGFSGDQRFFMSWAQQWRSKQTDSHLRNHVLTRPHSPPQYRVNGVLRNMDAWYDAFGVTKQHELYLPPDERVRIW
jgi:putative endopeptidase